MQKEDRHPCRHEQENKVGLEQIFQLLSEIKSLSFDVLLVAGTQSKYVGDTEAIHKQLAPGLCSMIKMEEVSEPLHETPGKTAEAVLLFCQVVQTG